MTLLKCCGRCGRIRPRQPLPQSTRHAGNAAAHAPGAHNANASSNETGHRCTTSSTANAAPRRNRSRCTSPAATQSTCPTTRSSPSADDTIPAAGEEAGVPLQKRAHRQSRGLEASPLGGGSSDWRARAYPPRRPRAVPSSITRTRGGVRIVKPTPPDGHPASFPRENCKRTQLDVLDVGPGKAVRHTRAVVPAALVGVAAGGDVPETTPARHLGAGTAGATRMVEPIPHGC